MSTEVLLVLAGPVFILGTPLVLFLLWFRVPRLRGRLIVIFGALTPALLLCAYATARYLFRPEAGIYSWAFYAFWAMAAPSYGMCLVLGIVLSFAHWPKRLTIRYLFGFVSPLSVGLTLAAIQ